MHNVNAQTGEENGFRWEARKLGRRFQNLDTDYLPRWRDVLRWKLGLGRRETAPVIPGLKTALTSVPLDLATIRKPDLQSIAATWLGHSTFLLQIGRRNYLTDPITSSNCSPLPLPTFRRRVECTVSLDEFPKIDTVLLSHNHYDHMDRATLCSLGSRVRIICPMGLRSRLRRWGFGCVTELSWGESTMDGEVRLTALPAQHTSGRTPFDRNHSLWCGWLIEFRGRKAVFLGDTGYAPFFRELGDYLGPVDVAFIPIGAYRPTWFMKPLHLSPVEAVQLHQDLRARHSVAMHWGTFGLADEPLGEPPHLLRATMKVRDLPPDVFRIPSLNETIAF